MNNETLVVIGDVHGDLRSLYSLLSRIPTSRRLIFVGDLIHKGENSAEVVRVVRALCDEGRAEVIRGNHEDMAGKSKWIPEEGDLTDEEREWLKSRPLFLKRNVGGENHLFLHGGMDRGSARNALRGLIENGLLPKDGDWDEEAVNKAVGSLSSKVRRKLEKVMRIRYLSPEGVFQALGSETEESAWWAEGYDGEFGQVWYGHQPWDEVRIDLYATGVDTGAGGEGYLTAMDIISGWIWDTEKDQQILK